MDVATHLLVPYAAALAALGWWRRREPGDRAKAAWAAVFGVGGMAPDLDGLVDPLSRHFDALYWLQHRGVSHTLVGAPIFGLIALGLLVLGARLHPKRLSLFAWRPSLVAAALLGPLTHLLLDVVTYAGVPLLWPFSFERVSLQLFHWLVWWLFPAGVVALPLHAAGRLPRHRLVAVGALFVVALLVVAGLRLAARPEPPEGGLVYPRTTLREWTVLAPLEDGAWEATLVRADGGQGHAITFTPSMPPGSEGAIARARATDAYRGFLMGAFGPEVVVARPLDEDGSGWNVTILDVAQRFEALSDPRWTPTEVFEDWGYVRFHVRGDEVEVVHRGW